MKHFIKSILPSISVNLIRGGMSYLPNSTRYGKTYRKTLSFLAATESFSQKELRQFQYAKLKELVTYAYKNTTYYKEIFDQVGLDVSSFSIEDFEKIPVLTKKTIRERTTDLITRQNIRKVAQTTGGTTSSVPLTFYSNHDSWNRINAFYDYHYQKIGLDVRKSNKIAILRGKVLPKEKATERVGKRLIISSFKLKGDNVKLAIAEIEKFDPDLLRAYPSSINILAEYLLSQKISITIPNLKAIVTSSETLYPHQKRNIQKAFGVPLCDIYGLTENCVMGVAYSADDLYHLDLRLGYPELLQDGVNVFKQKGLTGQIVATCFWNKVMPLIRYTTGDIAVSSGEPESFSAVLGREQEYLVDKDGCKITFTCSDEIFWDVKEKINSYQYIQTVPGKLTIKIEEKKSLNAEDYEVIKKRFDEYYSGFTADFELGIISRTKSGKHRFLINKLQP